MYDLWQSPGGKVEKGETSAQAAIRETFEETDLQIREEEMGYLLNDPNFNCDVYITKLNEGQIPQRTEPTKHGP